MFAQFQVRVLVACGTSIATATVAANKVTEIGKEAGLNVSVSQCKAMEIRDFQSSSDCCYDTYAERSGCSGF